MLIVFFGGNWTFYQRNAPVQNSTVITDWIEAHDVDILEWQANYADFSIIENVCGNWERRVYTDGRKFDEQSFKGRLTKHCRCWKSKYCMSLISLFCCYNYFFNLFYLEYLQPVRDPFYFVPCVLRAALFCTLLHE